MSLRALFSWVFCFVVVGCGGGSGAPAPKAPTYTVGGTVSGLSGTGLLLLNNATDELKLDANGSFVFTTDLPSGSAYAVTVETQPTAPAQSCSVTTGSGTVGTSAITSIAVTCMPPSCIRIVRNLLDDILSGYGQAGAPPSFTADGKTATFALSSPTANVSLLAGNLPLTQGSSYAVRFTVSNYAGNYPGANLEILGATPAVFSGTPRVTFAGNGVYALVFTYTGQDAPWQLRIGLNTDDAPVSLIPQGGFTVSSGSWEQLSSASTAPSEYAAGDHAWAFNYPNLNSYDAATGLVQEKRGDSCSNTYTNVWAVTADSFGDDSYDFPQQLSNNIATNYVFYVDSVPGRRLSVAQTNIDSLLANGNLPANVATPNGLIVEGGINDIVSDVTAAQLESLVASIIGNLESKHLDAVMVTVSPFGNHVDFSAAREQVRLAYNQWLRTQASARNHVYVYDMAATVSAGGIADENNPTVLDSALDSGDGLHPNAAGGRQIATGIKKLLDALMQ